MRTLNVDLLVTELLASKLCHDLVGPVGAVNNGIELLAEDDAEEMAEEAIALANRSARQATTVLQFFRLAYGAAGGSDIDFSDVRRFADALLGSHHVEIVWPGLLPDDGLPRGVSKLLMNILALAGEALPQGGQVAVRFEEFPGALEVVATLRGGEVRLRKESLRALDPNLALEELTPRSVQAHFCALVAQRLGSRLDLSPVSSEELVMSARVPVER